MNGKLTAQLFIFVQLCLAPFILCAPQNPQRSDIFQNAYPLEDLKGKDNDCDDDDDDDCKDECDDLSNMCGRKFWSIIGVVIGVVILAIIMMIVAVCICYRNKGKTGKKDSRHQSWTTRTPVPAKNSIVVVQAPRLEITPPPIHHEHVAEPGGATSSGNQSTSMTMHNNNSTVNRDKQRLNEDRENPSAPFNPHYQNVTRQDEPPPPYEFADGTTTFQGPPDSVLNEKR